MSTTEAHRPDITTLTTEQKKRVLEQVWSRRGSCHCCGGTTFTVGDALYLGYLFLSEDQDAYMVGLCCANPHCSAPHTGVRLSAAQFLTS
jgi:hypothetical protein